MPENTGGAGDRIDRYIEGLFIPGDEALRETLRAAEAEGLPPIGVPPALGKLLGILVRAVGAGRVLEIGTLGGYSAIWMARALGPGGRIISLEVDPHHAAVARANLERAEVAALVEVRVGRALDLLPALPPEELFDLAFIDADKVSYPAYLEWAILLVRPGGLIVADNVLRDGRVLDEETADENARGVAQFNRAVADDPRLDAIILPNRGGHDGVLIATVLPVSA